MFTRPRYPLLFFVLLLSVACRFLPGSQMPTPATPVPVTFPPENGETPIIMCTPPLCEANEVFFCDGDCPGGCGTTCATITPGPVTVTPEVGETPIIMCTPPLCEANEVFFCDGDCPGGCGTTCATITPAPATVTPEMGETPVLMCTPPACQPGEVFFCDGDCPGGCGTTCATVTPAAPGETGAAPADWAGLESWLVETWRSNTNPAAVRAALQAAGWQVDDNDWLATDFDGDLRDEWAVVLYDPDIPAEVFGRVGNLWIVNGEGIGYRLNQGAGSNTFETIAPDFVGVADMTGDHLPELVINQETCGANTCFGNYRILGYQNGNIQSLVSREPTNEDDPANTISMSYPDTRLEDVNQDGLADFLVHGGEIGSVGGGIVRTWSEVWSWDGTAVTLLEKHLDPTQYRHHILYEANDLLAAGNLDQALFLYEQAINDGSLVTSPFFDGTEAETKGAIDQFAAFRLILIDLLHNDPARAAGRLAWLQSNYPGSATAQGAAMLVNGWTGPQAQAALCAQIESTLAALPNPTGALADMGYGNPSLSAEDYCP